MKVRAIVLAAGAGRRFGGDKLVALDRGRPLLAWSLECALQAPVCAVTLVLAPGDTSLAEMARATHAAHPGAPPLELIVAQDAAEGMGASLRAGAAALGPDCAAVVFLADMPRVPWDLAGRLLAALGPGIDAAAPVHAGRRGHPVAFGPTLTADLQATRGDSGAREVLAGLGSRLALVETSDPGVLFDVDCPADLESG